jgi:peroxiredoxin Q/BCP
MSAFRDQVRKFADAHAQVLGISMDDLATQKRFADSLKLPFPLLADPKGTVTRAYDVEDPEDHLPKRVTFVITDRKIAKVLEGKDAIDPTPALGACTLPSQSPL